MNGREGPHPQSCIDFPATSLWPAVDQCFSYYGQFACCSAHRCLHCEQCPSLLCLSRNSKTSLKANSEATFFRKLLLEPLPYGKRVPSCPWWPGRALPLPCEDHFPLPPWRLTGLCIFWRKGMYSSFNSPVLCIVSAKEHALHKSLLNWWLDEYKGPKSRCLKDVKQNPADGLNIHLLSGCFIISQELLLKKSAEVSAAAACALLGA